MNVGPTFSLAIEAKLTRLSDDILALSMNNSVRRDKLDRAKEPSGLLPRFSDVTRGKSEASKVASLFPSREIESIFGVPVAERVLILFVDARSVESLPMPLIDNEVSEFPPTSNDRSAVNAARSRDENLLTDNDNLSSTAGCETEKLLSLLLLAYKSVNFGAPTTETEVSWFSEALRLVSSGVLVIARVLNLF